MGETTVAYIGTSDSNASLYACYYDRRTGSGNLFAEITEERLKGYLSGICAADGGCRIENGLPEFFQERGYRRPVPSDVVDRLIADSGLDMRLR